MSALMPSARARQTLRLALRLVAKGVGGLTAALLAWYLAFLIDYKRRQRRAKLPWLPGPTPFPVIGSLNLVIGEKVDGNGNPLVHHALMREAKKHKGIFGLWMGASYTMVISKPQIAEEAFCTHQLESGRPARGDLLLDRAANQSEGGHHVPSMYIMTRDGKGIAMSTGAYWRKVRGRLVAHITNKRASEANKGMISEEVQSAICDWRRRVARGEKITNLTAQLKRESMNMAMRVLFNKRFGADEPQDFKDLKYCVEWFFCNLSSGNPSDMIPALRALPNAFVRKATQVADLRDRVIGRLISEHRQEWEQLRAAGKMESRSQARGMVDQFFFDEVEGFEAKDENGATERMYLSSDETHVCIWDVVFALTDTTATTNEWLIYNLINHPEIQAKVHEELDRVVGSERLPTIEDSENMPYLWAVIKETMRYRIVSPLAAPHYTSQDLTLHDTDGKEFFVPKATTVYLHGYSMAMDPEFWDDPETFNPDRWFEDKQKGLGFYGQVRRQNVDHYKFIPFGLGPRMCPGYTFAKVAQFLQAATILHSFRWRLAPDAYQLHPEFIEDGRLDMTEEWGLAIMPRRYGEMGLVSAAARPAADLSRAQPGDADPANRALTNPSSRKTVTLIGKEPLGHDQVLLRFAFEDKLQALGLDPGQHLRIVMPNSRGLEPGKWNGKPDPEAGAAEVWRAYSPVSTNEDFGMFEIAVQVFQPSARFPDGGKVSQQLNRLLVHDTIDIAGPFGSVRYLGDSSFQLPGGRHEHRRMVGILAGGTGVAAAVQLIKPVLQESFDTTVFSLVYACASNAEDALLAAQLKRLASVYPEHFKVTFTTEVSESLLKQTMPPATVPGSLILICGPPALKERAFLKPLAATGFDEKAIVDLA